MHKENYNINIACFCNENFTDALIELKTFFGFNLIICLHNSDPIDPPAPVIHIDKPSIPFNIKLNLWTSMRNL